MPPRRDEQERAAGGGHSSNPPESRCCGKGERGGEVRAPLASPRTLRCFAQGKGDSIIATASRCWEGRGSSWGSWGEAPPRRPVPVPTAVSRVRAKRSRREASPLPFSLSSPLLSPANCRGAQKRPQLACNWEMSCDRSLTSAGPGWAEESTPSISEGLSPYFPSVAPHSAFLRLGDLSFERI